MTAICRRPSNAIVGQRPIRLNGNTKLRPDRPDSQIAPGGSNAKYGSQTMKIRLMRHITSALVLAVHVELPRRALARSTAALKSP